MFRRGLGAAKRLRFLSFFLLTQDQRFWQKAFWKEISKWLDMNSGEADSAGAVLPAHRGGFTYGQNKKGQRKQIKSMRKRILLAILPVLACFALLKSLPRAQAVIPASGPCEPNFNTPEGCAALNSLTTGAG